MRPLIASVVFGGAVGGPPLLAQMAPGLSPWFPPALSLFGTIVVGLIAYLWKRADGEQGRRWDGALAAHAATLSRLEHEINALREWRYATASSLAVIESTQRAFRCRRRDDACPDEDP